MAFTTDTNLSVITAGYQICTIIDEVQSPSAEQTAIGMEVLNDMMLNLDVVGIRTGYFPQNSASGVIPLQDYDVQNVKLLLAAKLALRYGVLGSMDPDTKGEIKEAFKELSKRYIEYFESDLTGLPFSQGGLFGPGRI